MKNFLLALLLLTVSVWALGNPPKRNPITYTLEFDETGKLISEPPIRLLTGDKLVFKVAVSRQLMEKRALEVYKSYYNTYLKIQDSQKYLEATGVQPIADFMCRVEDVKRELVAEMTYIFTRYPAIAEEVKMVNSSRYSHLTAVNSPLSATYVTCSPLTDFVPKADDLIIPIYTVLVSDINGTGVAIKDELGLIKIGVLTDFVSNPHTHFISNAITITKDLSKVRYELRQKNNYYESVLVELRANPMPQKLIEVFEKIKGYKEEYEKAKKVLVDFDKSRLSVGYNFRQHTDTLKLGINYMKTFINKDIIEWMLRFIWLNDGKMLANPFLHGTKSPSAATSLRNAKDSLQNVVDKIVLLKEVLKNDTQVQTYTSQRLNDYLKKYNDFLEEQRTLKLRIETEEKKTKNDKVTIDSENAGITAHNDQLLREPWLYRGLFFVSDRDSVFARYHDASDNYKLMNQYPLEEIIEGQKMMLLVENEKPTNQLNVKYEAKEIDFSLSFLEEEIDFAFKGTKIEPQDAKKRFWPDSDVPDVSSSGSGNAEVEALRKAVNDFTNEEKKLVANIFQQGIADLPLKRRRDPEPVFTYKYLDVAVGKNPPYEVTYSIAMTRPGKADSVLTDTRLNLSYSVYALHRFRFKIGPAYSSFRKDVFEIKDGTPFRTTEVSGLDALFGLQVFLTKRRINIRERDLNLRRPFAYLGFPINADILRNVYIGGGFELLNGLGLCAGVQIGQTSKLRFQNNTYTVDDKRWRAGGPFVSLLMDLSVFRTIFNFKTLQLPNPFRS